MRRETRLRSRGTTRNAGAQPRARRPPAPRAGTKWGTRPCRASQAGFPRRAPRRLPEQGERTTLSGRRSDRAWRISASVEEDGVDDGLHRAGDARGSEREQTLVDLVFHGLFRVDVFKDIDAVLRQQDLVDVKDLLRILERQDLEAPGIGADHRHVERGKVVRPVDSEARLHRAIALVVLADELGPAG